MQLLPRPHRTIKRWPRRRHAHHPRLRHLFAVGLAAAFAALPAARVLAQDHTIALAGPEQLFLSHKQMNCGMTERGAGADVTDMGISAFRRQDGSVVVLAGNQNNYYLEGPSVEEAARKTCANLVKPVNASDPSQFMGRRWLMAIYAKQYNFTLGFVHNEYHGNNFFREGCERTSQREFECWYGSAGLVVSRDGGFTFETPPPPANVLAAPPVKFETRRKRVGASTPKVVGNPHDGKVYALISYFDVNRGMPANQCVLRGSGLALDDWRAWDGKDFTINMGSPYSVQRGVDCTPVLRLHSHSVRYVPAIDRFVVLGVRAGSLIYAFSKDLVNWSEPKTLMQVGTSSERRDPTFYFSLLDPSSSSRNFDTLEGSPYLFFVRMVEGRRRATDIYRIPITIK